MEITDIRVFPVHEEKLKAYVTITLDNCFVIRDIAHPLNAVTRDRMEKTILVAYERQIQTSRDGAATESPASERH